MKSAMESRPIIENGIVVEPVVTGAPRLEWPGPGDATEPAPAPPAELRFPGEDGGQSLGAMAQRDLMATLQLLAERAQYITGATGAAIALRDSSDMTCRASAGTSAPEVGAHLQVDSGLSGESVRTMKTLRCDDAASDPRVNRESCEALGIASVVVMPLVRGNEVIGVFELFSDKPNVFEARDITALERMGAMVFTAMEHAVAALQAKADAESAAPGNPGEGAGNAGAGPAEGLQPVSIAEPKVAGAEFPAWVGTEPEGATSGPIDSAAGGEASGNASLGGIGFHMKVPPAASSGGTPLPDGNDADNILEIASEEVTGSSSQGHAGSLGTTFGMDAPEFQADDPISETGQPVWEGAVSVVPDSGEEQAAAAVVPSEVSNLRRCEGCGFPVSEGRQFCLDCERKAALEQQKAVKSTTGASEPVASDSAPTTAAPAAPEAGPMLQFLHDEPQRSWVATHKYTVGAIAVALAGIVIFVFAR